MKKVITLIICLGLIVFFIAGYTYNLDYKEDTLYSEKTLNNLKNENNKEVNENLLTRNDAINKALKVLNDGLGVNLNKDKISEYVQLTKDDNKYIWSINFIDSDNKGSYTCEINSYTKEINKISLNEIMYDKVAIKSYYKQTTKYPINKEEIYNIINPLMKVLKIDLGKYKFEITTTYSDEKGSLRHIDVVFNNINSSFRVQIDYKNKKLRYYNKLV